MSAETLVKCVLLSDDNRGVFAEFPGEFVEGARGKCLEFCSDCSREVVVEELSDDVGCFSLPNGWVKPIEDTKPNT
jgi:hypothetical protein